MTLKRVFIGRTIFSSIPSIRKDYQKDTFYNPCMGDTSFRYIEYRQDAIAKLETYKNCSIRTTLARDFLDIKYPELKEIFKKPSEGTTLKGFFKWKT